MSGFGYLVLFVFDVWLEELVDVQCEIVDLYYYFWYV